MHVRSSVAKGKAKKKSTNGAQKVIFILIALDQNYREIDSPGVNFFYAVQNHYVRVCRKMLSVRFETRPDSTWSFEVIKWH